MNVSSDVRKWLEAPFPQKRKYRILPRRRRALLWLMSLPEGSRVQTSIVEARRAIGPRWCGVLESICSANVTIEDGLSFTSAAVLGGFIITDRTLIIRNVERVFLAEALAGRATHLRPIVWRDGGFLSIGEVGR